MPSTDTLFLLTIASRSVLRPTQPRIQTVPGQATEVSYLPLIPRLIIRGAIPQLHNFSMVWCLIKHRDNVTVLQNLSFQMTRVQDTAGPLSQRAFRNDDRTPSVRDISAFLARVSLPEFPPRVYDFFSRFREILTTLRQELQIILVAAFDSRQITCSKTAC